MESVQAFLEQTMTEISSAIQQDPNRDWDIIRDSMDAIIEAADRIHDLAEQAGYHIPDPVLAFPNPGKIWENILSHIYVEAAEAPQLEPGKHVLQISDEEVLKAAPSIKAAIWQAIREYKPTPAILLAREITIDEHSCLAQTAIDNLQDREIKALRKLAAKGMGKKEP